MKNNKIHKISYCEKMERERAENKLYTAIYICIVILAILSLAGLFSRV